MVAFCGDRAGKPARREIVEPAFCVTRIPLGAAFARDVTSAIPPCFSAWPFGLVIGVPAPRSPPSQKTRNPTAPIRGPAFRHWRCSSHDTGLVQAAASAAATTPAAARPVCFPYILRLPRQPGPAGCKEGCAAEGKRRRVPPGKGELPRISVDFYRPPKKTPLSRWIGLAGCSYCRAELAELICRHRLRLNLSVDIFQVELPLPIRTTSP